MTQHSIEYAFILGTHASLSFAELQAVLAEYDDDTAQLTRSGSIAWYRTSHILDAATLMNRLGGTIKIVKMVGVFDEDTLLDWIKEQIQATTKFHFGFSMYSTQGTLSPHKYGKIIQRMGLAVKQSLKEDEISSRFVSSKEIALSSVIVHKERLLKNGVDIVLIKDGPQIRLGKTLAVQPFQAFSKRDYGRPQRDSRSGMLPPKLARMLVNISQPTADSVILDPFCGSGTILQEAMLMGFSHVIGSDISSKAIADTTANLQWMKLPQPPLTVCDARDLLRKKIVAPGSVDRIVFEGFLGKPRPHAKEIPAIVQELTPLYRESFNILATVLAPGGRIVCALPFWHTVQKQILLDIQKICTPSGLQIISEPLFYRRPQSMVGRHIICLSK